MLTYEQMYVPISLSFLRNLYQQNTEEIEQIAEEFFSIDYTINPLLGKRKVIAISLFYAHKMNGFPDEYPIDQEGKEHCNRRYLAPLFRNLKRFTDSYDPTEWKISLYLCPKSFEIFKPERNILEELRNFDFLEIHIMKNPSVGHGPGALWRFLALSDFRIDELLIKDIDEDWYMPLNQWHQGIQQYDKAFARGVLIPNNFGWLKPEKPWTGHGGTKGYPSILGSKIYIQPRKLGIPDLDILVASHIFQRKQMIKTNNPNAQLDVNEPITPYNQANRVHPYGFGNHWYKYCFDERFLKHVIFPYVAEKGELCSYCIPQNVMSDMKDYLSLPTLCDYLADFQYTQRVHPDNIIINNYEISKEIL